MNEYKSKDFKGKKTFFQKKRKKVKKALDKSKNICYNNYRRRQNGAYGSIAQLGEHLPYKQRVIGSSPVVPTSTKVQCNCGPVAQLVRAPACHAGGRGFEPHPGRHLHASVAQSVEQRTENPRVVGSIPTGGTSGNNSMEPLLCGFSSFGRARPCQGRGGGFEPRNPLHQHGLVSTSPCLFPHFPVWVISYGAIAKW